MSHHSEAHSSCGAPVRQALMIPRLLLQTALFSRPPLPSFHFFSSASLGLFWEHSSPLLPAHLFSSHPHPPQPHASLYSPLLRAGGRGAITHHLVITGTKGALVAGVCGHSTCNATGERAKGKSPPPLPVPSSPPSSPPPCTMKTLSVWIRKERCAPAEGITLIKAVPPHLCTAVPLSTFFFNLKLILGFHTFSGCF